MIFLYRKQSLRPFARRFPPTAAHFLDFLEIGEDGRVSLLPQHEEKIAIALKQYHNAKDKLLEISFVSLTGANPKCISSLRSLKVDYLFLLREIALACSSLESECLFYLSAAVSDFYLPEERMSEHKIQSRERHSGLNLDLLPVPKMLGVLTKVWAPKSFVVSFKLETQQELLHDKVLGSFSSYGQQVIIGNLLSSHKDKICLYKQAECDNPLFIQRTEEEKTSQIDIETLFISKLAEIHRSFILTKQK